MACEFRSEIEVKTLRHVVYRLFFKDFVQLPSQNLTTWSLMLIPTVPTFTETGMIS